MVKLSLRYAYVITAIAYVGAYSSMPDFNGGLTKLPFELEYALEITSHSSMQI